MKGPTRYLTHEISQQLGQSSLESFQGENEDDIKKLEMRMTWGLWKLESNERCLQNSEDIPTHQSFKCEGAVMTFSNMQGLVKFTFHASQGSYWETPYVRTREHMCCSSKSPGQVRNGCEALMDPRSPLGAHTRQPFGFGRKHVLGIWLWGISAAIASGREGLNWPLVFQKQPSYFLPTPLCTC